MANRQFKLIEPRQPSALNEYAGRVIGTGLSIPAVATRALYNTGGLPAANGTATMSATNLMADQIIQRSSTNDGSFGIGQASVPVLFSSIAASGTIHARFSSGGATRGDLQPEWIATSVVANASPVIVNVPGLDVTKRWGYLDILDSSGVWQNGTTRIGAGVNVAIAGQSLAGAFMLSGDLELSSALATATSANGSPLAVNSFTRIFATSDVYSTAGVSGVTWSQFKTGTANTSNGDHPGAGAAALCNYISETIGCNVGMFGHAVAGTAQSTWQWTPIGSINLRYQQFALVANTAGGKWEYEIWIQGHNEAEAGVLGHYYQTDLDFRVFGTGSSGGYAGINSIVLNGLTSRTGAVKRIVETIPFLHPTPNYYYGRTNQVNEIRKGAKAWCAASKDGTHPNAFYVNVPGASAPSDGIHPGQLGGLETAKCMARAIFSDNNGPSIASAARDPLNPNDIIVTMNVNGNLVVTGNWHKRFSVYIAGSTLNFCNVANGSGPGTTGLTANQLRLTLQKRLDVTDWADGDSFDVWLAPPYDGDPSVNVSGDMIRDDRFDVYDLTKGRAFQNSVVPTNAAALNSSGTVTPTSNYTNTYIAPKSMIDLTMTGASYDSVEHLAGFGKPLIAGYGTSPQSFVGNHHELAYSTTDMTIVARIRTPTSFSATGNKTIYNNGQFGIYLAASTGKIFASGQNGGATTTTASALLTNHVYWIAATQTATATTLYVWDGTTLVRPTPAAATPSPYTITGSPVIVNASGSDFFAGVSGASIFEVATYDAAIYTGTGFTPPSTPLVGNEANLISLYRMTLEGSNGSLQPNVVRFA